MAVATLTSVVVWDRVQRDGRRHVREQHTDQYGRVHLFDFVAEAGAAAAAQLAGHAAQLVTDLQVAETAANLANAYLQIAPVLLYSTAGQLQSLVRSTFATLTGWDAVRLGKFINSLGLTDNQLQNLFGVSAGAQLTALKNRLATLAARYDAVIADQGQ